MQALQGGYKLTDLYFYGSGCLYPHGAGIVKGVLNLCFQNASISVESDLLAAGIALYGDGSGAAAILGTGELLVATIVMVQLLVLHHLLAIF